MTVIVTNGKARAVARKEWPFPAGVASSYGPTAGYVPLMRGDGLAMTYEGIYKSQPLVFAAVNKIVNGVARNPFKVYEYDTDGESRRRVRTHPLASLMKRPYARGTQFSLMSHIVRSCEVHGQALLVKTRPAVGDAPTELWPVPWRYVTVYRDERGPIGYAVTIGNETFPLGPEDVVHFDPRDGVSPLEALRRTIALEDAMLQYSADSMRNGVNGGRVVFSTDQKLNDQSMTRFREELTKVYAGPENAGKPIVGDQGMKASSLTVKSSEMELVAHRKFSREEVCVAYDISPALLGLEQASYASVVEYRKALYDAVAARITFIEQTLQAQLVDVEPSWDGVFVEADMNALVREDLEARARAHMMLLQAGVETRNEARRTENLPPIDDPLANTIFVPLNMAPLDGSGELPDSTTAGVPMQGQTDPETFPASASAVELLAEAIKAQPAPVVHVTIPTEPAKARRIERDDAGNITRIIEE